MASKQPVDPVFEELGKLTTEKVNQGSRTIDRMSIGDILRLINREDHKIPKIVKQEIPHIVRAVNIIVRAFRQGGRLFYIGAGTSGRLGVLDASECPPTFGVPPEMVQGIIAGGSRALIRSREGVEDLPDLGARALLDRGFTRMDVACGLSASRRTPFVLGALNAARKKKAKTIFISCNPRTTVKIRADVKICPVVGPEIIMGSTRMKAGTAEKLILNMMTTAAMIRLGKTYGNLMVDLQMTSKKLSERSKRIVMMVTGLEYAAAAGVLREAKGHVKSALVMVLADCDYQVAQKRLRRAGGFVRRAITS